MVSLNLTVSVEEGIEQSTIFLTGEIDIYTVDQIKKDLLPLTEKKGHIVIVNLKKVNYMDSTGLGLFIKALKSTQKHKSKLKLTQLQKRVARLFKITGLDEVIQIESSAGCK
ncbi:MAG TPA: STAS domain-containing protein [Bacillota bacterium]|nr:STAS domain-containing protein [Bacillota bacterium]